MNSSRDKQVQEIKALLEKMKISEHEWDEEERTQSKLKHPSSQSKNRPIKETK
jgi:hypothetical protein